MLRSLELYARLLGRFSFSREWSEFPALRFLEFFRDEAEPRTTTGSRRDTHQTIHETHVKYLSVQRINPVVRELIQAASGSDRADTEVTRLTRIIRRTTTMFAESPAGIISSASSRVDESATPEQELPPVRMDMVKSPDEESPVEGRGRYDSAKGEKNAGESESSESKMASAPDIRSEQSRRIVHKHDRHLARVLRRSLREIDAPLALRRLVDDEPSSNPHGRERISYDGSVVDAPNMSGTAMGSRSMAAPGKISMGNAAGTENRNGPFRTAPGPVSEREPVEDGEGNPELLRTRRRSGENRFSRPVKLIHARDGADEPGEAAADQLKVESVENSSSATARDGRREIAARREFVEDTLKETLRNLPRPDLELIANKVYRGIERRIAVEIDRKGFRV